MSTNNTKVSAKDYIVWFLELSSNSFFLVSSSYLTARYGRNYTIFIMYAVYGLACSAFHITFAYIGLRFEIVKFCCVLFNIVRCGSGIILLLPAILLYEDISIKHRADEVVALLIIFFLPWDMLISQVHCMMLFKAEDDQRNRHRVTIEAVPTPNRRTFTSSSGPRRYYSGSDLNEEYLPPYVFDPPPPYVLLPPPPYEAVMLTFPAETHLREQV